MKPTCVFMAPVRTMEARDYEKTAVMSVEGFGFYTDHVIVEELLPSNEVQAFRQSCEDEELLSKQLGYPVEGDHPCFASVEDALDYADACDAMTSLWQDIQAFNAPSECGVGPSKKIEAEIALAEGKVVCYWSQDLTPCA